MPPVFLKASLRMGTKEYLDQALKARVLPWTVATFPETQEYLFVKDGAPCHTRKTVQTWLSEIMINLANAHLAILFT